MIGLTDERLEIIIENSGIPVTPGAFPVIAALVAKDAVRTGVTTGNYRDHIRLVEVWLGGTRWRNLMRKYATESDIQGL